MAERMDQQTAQATAVRFRAFNGVSFALFVLAIGLGVTVSYLTRNPTWQWVSLAPALYLLFAVKVVQQWEKAVVLRFGKFHRLVGPGLFMLIPIVDSVAAWVDQRVMVTPFGAERTLTKDTVPVDVDAVMFWVVWDARKAALEVSDYYSAISWAAQTALREIIGKMVLSDILVGREKMDAELQRVIDERTTPWGIAVQSVEIRDIVIPTPLEDAMSRQAQAERERLARITLADAEKEVARTFLEASEVYAQSDLAFRLRAMNMLFEGLKAGGSVIVVPTDAANTLGAAYGLTTSLIAKAVSGQKNSEKDDPGQA